MVFRYFILLLLYLSCSSWSSHPDALEMTIDQRINAMHLDRSKMEIYISKIDHTLTLSIGSVILKQYKCVFGLNPIDDKKCEGDKCTPEGTFHIGAKYPHPLWSKFMWVDYPTAESRQKFELNKKLGKIPPNATIGGSIGIHGVAAHRSALIPAGINWTDGCISLSNADINELYKYINVGTKIVISK
jgi:murein L,D-transpeptidase YafK